MKRLLFAVVLGLILIAAFATTATADAGPHGKFNGSTEACASCHRAHSAASSDGFLLVTSDVYALCTSCHDGSGAYTNVVDGYFDTSTGDPSKATWAATTGTAGESGVGLFGGGFVNARMLTDFGNNAAAEPTTNTGTNINSSTTAWAILNAYDSGQGAPTGRAVTSHHVVTGGAGTVWGSGAFQTAATTSPFGAGSFTLECTSCHDPHGNAGKDATGRSVPSYRLLRYTPDGSTGYEIAANVGSGNTFTWNTAVVPSSAGVSVPDPTVKWYTPNNDATLDPSVTSYRARAGEIYVANFAGIGDYMGRYFAYRRPAAVASGTGTFITCGTPTTGSQTACGAATGTAFNNVPAQDVLGYWCALCHDRYLAQGGVTRTTDTTDPGYHYRHRSQGNTGTAGQYTCVSCHNAHGTVAQASALASSATYANDSALLKADNRAVCVRCHASAVNFFNTTVSPSAIMVVP